jgi:hypothetical protein
MYELTDFNSYQGYFRLISEQHKGVDGFLFGDDDVAINEGRVWKGKKLWLEPWQPVKISDPLSDNYLKDKKGSLWIGGPVAGLKFQQRLDFYGECESIVEDIISRMLMDRTEELLITRLTSYTYGMGEFMFSSTKMLGCRFDFTFQDPSGFSYDESKWDV